MKDFKVYSILSLVLLILGVFSWTQIIKPEQVKEETAPELLPEKFADKLHALSIVTKNYEIKIVNQEGLWVVTSPQPYLGNQEYIEKGLQIMGDVVSNHNFKLEEDRFGLDPGRAFYRFEFANGQEKRLIVGENDGPADTIYLLDKDAGRVFVVHNVWAQFLIYPPERFYHPNLPIPGKIVKSLFYSERGKVIWKVEPAENQQLRFIYKDQEAIVEKAQGLWFFKKMREFELENLQFGTPNDFQTFGELHVESDKGNIMFEFNPSSDKIRVTTFNVFAKTKPYSLKSLGYEIEKVIKSVKK